MGTVAQKSNASTALSVAANLNKTDQHIGQHQAGGGYFARTVGAGRRPGRRAATRTPPRRRRPRSRTRPTTTLPVRVLSPGNDGSGFEQSNSSTALSLALNANALCQSIWQKQGLSSAASVDAASRRRSRRRRTVRTGRPRTRAGRRAGCSPPDGFDTSGTRDYVRHRTQTRHRGVSLVSHRLTRPAAGAPVRRTARPAVIAAWVALGLLGAARRPERRAEEAEGHPRGDHRGPCGAAERVRRPPDGSNDATRGSPPDGVFVSWAPNVVPVRRCRTRAEDCNRLAGRPGPGPAGARGQAPPARAPGCRVYGRCRRQSLLCQIDWHSAFAFAASDRCCGACSTARAPSRRSRGSGRAPGGVVVGRVRLRGRRRRPGVSCSASWPAACTDGARTGPPAAHW